MNTHKLPFSDSKGIMDPSEYEDTVEKRADALGAGALEEFLHGAEPVKFVPFDVLKEAGDVYVATYNLQEVLKKFPEGNLEDYVQELDEKALKVAEYKEDYLQRRKKLSAIVKAFLLEKLPTYEDPEAFDGMILYSIDSSKILFDPRCFLEDAIKEVIDTFKKEYDHLSNFAKFGEVSYLALYKDTRSYIAESKTAIEQATRSCLATQDVFKRVAEQFHNAETIIASSSNSLHGGTTHGSTIAPMDSLHISQFTSAGQEIERLKEKHQEELAHELSVLKAQYDTDLMDLKTSYEKQAQNKELAIQQSFEQRNAQTQQEFDRALFRKDTEIQSLLHSLTTVQQQLLHQSQAQETLENEHQKRVQLEERLRQSMMEISDLNTTVHNLNKQLDNKNIELQQLQTQTMQTTEAIQTKLRLAEESSAELRSKVIQLELQLAANPPRDLSNFLSKVGYHISKYSASTKQDDDENNDQKGSSLHQSHALGKHSGKASSTESVDWTKVETFVVDKLRRMEHDAIAARVAESGRAEQVTSLQTQCDALKRRVAEQEKEMRALENDLMRTQQHMLQKPSVSNNDNGNKNTKKQALVMSTPQRNEADELGQLLLHADETMKNDGFEDDSQATHSTNHHQSSASASSAVSSVVHESLLNQRDRFLKARRELEVQLRQYQQREASLEQEIERLTAENVTLYERCTSLRGGGGNEGHYQQHRGGFGTASKQQKLRRTLFTGDDEHDQESGHPQQDASGASSMSMSNTSMGEEDIDKRYHGLAQQQYLFRLLPGQQWWASFARAIFLDPYTRQAVMLYLVLLHLCAIMYVWEILTPQLQEEIDARQKELWNLQTLAQADNHPDMHS